VQRHRSRRFSRKSQRAETSLLRLRNQYAKTLKRFNAHAPLFIANQTQSHLFTLSKLSVSPHTVSKILFPNNTVFCFRNTVLCFRNTVLCFRNTVLCFRNTVLCFRNALFPKYCALFPKYCALFPKYCALFPKYCALFPKYCALFPKYCALFPVFHAQRFEMSARALLTIGSKGVAR
jgi:hypothetical protein